MKTHETVLKTLLAAILCCAGAVRAEPPREAPGRPAVATMEELKEFNEQMKQWAQKAAAESERQRSLWDLLFEDSQEPEGLMTQVAKAAERLVGLDAELGAEPEFKVQPEKPVRFWRPYASYRSNRDALRSMSWQLEELASALPRKAELAAISRELGELDGSLQALILAALHEDTGEAPAAKLSRLSFELGKLGKEWDRILHRFEKTSHAVYLAHAEAAKNHSYEQWWGFWRQGNPLALRLDRVLGELHQGVEKVGLNEGRKRALALMNAPLPDEFAPPSVPAEFDPVSRVSWPYLPRRDSVEREINWR